TTSGNAPLTVQFTDGSTINPTAWSWDFGDNSTSTEQNPVHTYAANGNYTVNLTISNSYGSNSCVKTGYITVGSGIPVGNFSANVTTSTAPPLSVQFTDTTTVNPTAWYWDFGDNATSAEQNPVHTYTAIGNYTVNLTVSNSYGSTSCVKTGYISVSNGIPVANFIASWTSGYAPLHIQFIDTSTVNPTSWAWDFGDGTTSTNQNPVHTYGAVGNYTVTLTATNGYGSNPITKTDYIYVGTGYSQNFTFTASDQAVYQQEVVIHRTEGTNFEEDINGWKLWHVYVGDRCREDYSDLRFKDATGSQTAYYLLPDYNLTQARFYVRLDRADQPGTLQVLYGNSGVTAASNADATGHLIDEFTTLSPDWDISGVTSATIDNGQLKTTPKTSTIEAYSTHAVKRSITPIPGAFSADVDMRYANMGTSTQLQYGELFLIAYTPTGNTAIGWYSGSSSNVCGCFKSIINGAITKTGTCSRPRAGMMHLTMIRDAANTVSVYENGTLQATGTMAGNITAIGLSNTMELTEIKTAYWDNLVVRSFSTTPPAESGLPPVTNFTANRTGGSAPLVVRFNDTSRYYPTSWSWDFGDGATSTSQNPVHTYTANGNYTVNLTVANTGGNATLVKTDYITVGSGIPVANFTSDITRNYAPFTVRFTDTSTINPTSWSWDFGDGTNSNEQNPVHTYTNVGNYTVNLTVSNIYGTNTLTKDGYIHAGRYAYSQNITYTAGDQNVIQQEVIIHRTTGNPYEENRADGTKVWHVQVGDLCRADYGDVRFADATGTQLAYYLWSYYTAEQGRFFVRLEKAYQPGTLQVFYGDSGVLSTSNADAIDAYLIDEFNTLNSTWSGGAIENGQLTYTSTGATSGIYGVTRPITPIPAEFLMETDLSYEPYGYHDGDVMLEVYTADSYARIGYYQANWGGSGAFATMINGLVMPFLGANSALPEPGAMNLKITRDASNKISAYMNGTLMGTGTMAGNITRIGFRVHNMNNGAGGHTSHWDNLAIRSYSTAPPAASGFKPVGSFLANRTGGDAPLTVRFTDSSFSSPTSWAWDFGDGARSTDQNPIHTYTSGGNFTVNLTVTNSYGSNSLVKTGYISVGSGIPVASFTVNTTSGNAPLIVKFTDTSTNTPTSWSWDFGDSSTSADQTPVHTYAADGNYTVNLTVTNSYGSNSLVKTGYISVGSGIPVAGFTADVTNGYSPVTVQFIDTSTINPTSWAWDFGDGTTSIEQNPVHTYSTYGTNTVTLTAANGYGSNTMTKAGYILSGKNAYSQKIDFSAGEPSLYQQVVVIHRTTGTAYEDNANGMKVWHLYAGGHCREDYGDVRFTDATGSPVKYYLQPGYTTEQARFFIRLEGADHTGALKVLYGEPGITTTSDVSATNITVNIPGYVFDGFSTLATDWDRSGVASATIDNGRLMTYPNSNTMGAYSTAAVKRSITSIPGAFAAEVDLTYVGRSTSVPGRSRGELYLVLYNSSTSYAATGYYDNYYGTGQTYNGSFFYNINGTSANSGQGTRPAFGSMHLTITRDAANTVSVYEDGVLRGTGIMPGDITAIGLTNTKFTTNSYYYYAYWDNLVVRAATASLPSATAFSGEGYTDAAPAASFTGTPVYGLSHTIRFTDTSANYPTTWSWDFGDGITSTLQNPVHTFAADGNYTVTLSATNEYGSNTETIRDFSVETPVVASVTVSPTSVQLNVSETRQFTAVLLDQRGNVMTNTSVTWSSSDETVGTVDTKGLFTARHLGKANVTISAGGLNASAEVTVIIPTPDLTASAISPPSFSPGHNTVTATIHNLGPVNAGAFKANFTIGGNTQTINVAGVTAGSSSTISATDPVFRKYNEAVPITIDIDTENAIPELNETNNMYTATVTVGLGGDYYSGGRFYTGNDLESGAFVEGHVALVYALSGGYQTGGGWYSTNAAWSPETLPIPPGATIKEARLYQSYTWNSFGNPGFTLQFNGNTVNQSAFYGDGIDNFNGQAVYNVTPYFDKSGNTAIITAASPGGGLYGTLLAVVYENASEPYRMIWLDEGCDSLNGAATGYAMYRNVITNNVYSAKVTTILPSGGDNSQGSILFNNQNIALTGTGGSDPGFKYYTVTGALQNGTNELGVYCDGYMNLAAAFLEVTRDTVSEAHFTATPLTGTVPHRVTFTDTSTGSPTSWFWDFGDGTNSADQNPSHRYLVEGTFNVTLTVSNSLGSDSETRTGYITVNAPAAPVAAFSATPTTGSVPLTVTFTDATINTPTSWAWDFGDSDTANATEQNPVHTYAAIGTYTVKLTATNALGSDDETKTGFITATAANPAPKVAFTATPTSGNFPLAVQFNDTSIGNVTAWEWDFTNDGVVDSIEKNPAYTYMNAGSYAVNLTVTGPEGTNSTVKSGYITVNVITGTTLPLINDKNGTVSGGLYVASFQPVPFASQPATGVTSRDFDQPFTVPAFTNIQWAKVYVNVYSMSGSRDIPSRTTTSLDGNGDGT
ncbi:MAG: DUF2341 domain-containing protein, partial [Methanoregula sp.]|nr:DUF2341 domain-containing protein [Methanoregula sp.]